MTYVIPSFTAFFITIFGCLFALKYFPRWGLLDKPKKYGLDRAPIPYYGGLILYISFVICVCIFFSNEQ